MSSAQPTVDHSDAESVENEVPTTHNKTDNKKVAEELRISANSPEVEITNTRLFSLEELDLNMLTQCTVLSLRKNLIHELSPFPLHLANRLTELDLFDNKIRTVGDFFSCATVADPLASEKLIKQAFPNPFCSLTKLDLSYNQIKTISGLEPLGPTLKELYLVENKIKDIQGLDSLVNLELLELGGNRIREIGDGVRNLTKLKQLWLGKNKIVSIGDSLHSLASLELLSLQANRILKLEPNTFTEGANPQLKELYLSENGIDRIENLPLHNLRLLDFSFDPIAAINEDVINPANMPHLEEFWLTDGKINSWDEISKLDAFKDIMRTVYLERNPIEQDKRYRDKVYMYLPFLAQIDSWPVVNKGNLEADRTIQRRSSA